MSDPKNAPRGWYPDPSDATRERFWDGQEWKSTRPRVSPQATTTAPPGQEQRPGRDASRRRAATAVAIIIAMLLFVLVAQNRSSDSGSSSSEVAGGGYPEFQEAVDAGAECSELYEIRRRNELNISGPEAERVNDQLRQLKCYSPDSSRDDTPDDYSEFEDALDSGAGCRELYEIRNRWAGNSELKEMANKQLRAFGCWSPDAERQEPGQDASGRPGRLSVSEESLAATVPSAECAAAVLSAADAYDTATGAQFNSMAEQSLNMCSSAAEWLAASRMHPGSLGLQYAAEVNDLALINRCFLAPNSPVCADAEAIGALRPLSPGGD